MNNEIHKICMYCSTVYEGDIKAITKDVQYSHGVCNKPKCRIEHISNAFQCDDKRAMQIMEAMGLERLVREK